MTATLERTGWKRGLAVLLAIAALLASSEWALRSNGYEYTRSSDRALQGHIDIERSAAYVNELYRLDRHQLWEPRPGAVLPWTNGERINPDGFRGPQLPVERTKGVLRIAFIGGAATMGVGVRYDDTFPALTARLLTEHTLPVESLNAGVEGYSLRQCLERYRDLVRPYRPHVVVLAVGYAVSYRQANGGLTDDQRIQRGNLPDLALDRNANEWPRSRILQFGRWFADAIDGRYWADRDFEFQQLRLAPTAGDLDWPGARRVPVDDYYHSLSWFLQETRQDGAHLILLSMPTSPSTFVPPVADVYQRTVSDFADREKLILLDARNAYLEALRDDIPKEDLFQSDQYPSECGHLQIAQALTDTIAAGIAARAQSATSSVPQNK